MAKKSGKFIKKFLYNTKLEIYIGDTADWYSYSDNDSMSYVLLVVMFEDYDEDSGIITFKSETGHTFWVAEEKIEMFWEHGKGFDIMESSTSTIRSGKNRLKNKKNNDII